MLGKGRRIVDQRTARTRVHDDAAIEDDGVVGHIENLLSVLLDDNGRHALFPDNPLQGLQKLLDQDRRQAFQGLVEEQELWIEHEGAGDGEHLLFAARQMASQIGAALLQARKHVVHLSHGPGSGTGHRRQVLVHGQGFKDVALLRHPADAGARTRVRGCVGEIAAREGEHAAASAGDADDRVDERRLAGAVAAEHRQRAAALETQIDVRDHDGLAVAGGYLMQGEQVTHRHPSRDRRLSPVHRMRLPRPFPR